MHTYTSTNGRRRVIPISYGIALCSLVFISYYAVRRVDSPEPTTLASTHLKPETIKQQTISVGSPVRILIPKINVNAVLEYVGLNSDGEMDEPTVADNAAWFNRHPLPGDLGTAVIAGHFGYKENKPAVFDNLHKLSKGDEIYIKDSKGADITFIVQELKDYVPDQDATEVFGSNDGKSRLNLITCKGAWNESLQSYDTRLVVFAERKVL